MNQRLQEEEICRVRKRYADDGLFRAVSSIGLKLENQTPQFGIRTEETYVYTLRLLARITRLGPGARFRVEELWDTEYAECRRLTKNPCEDESRKVVGIVFALAARALLSSADGFYRYTLTFELAKAVFDNGFDGCEELIRSILELEVPDGWMDERFAGAAAGVCEPSTPSGAGGQPSLALTNTVFSLRLFGKEERLAQARAAILMSFSTADEPADGTFDPSVQSDWYFVLRAVVEAGVTTSTAKVTGTGFIRQMHAWLPGLFRRKEGEDEAGMLQRYSRSLSAERKNWIEGTGRKEVCIRDIIPFSAARGCPNAKALRLSAAAKGLKQRLEEIKEAVRKQ